MIFLSESWTKICNEAMKDQNWSRWKVRKWNLWTFQYGLGFWQLFSGFCFVPPYFALLNLGPTVWPFILLFWWWRPTIWATFRQLGSIICWQICRFFLDFASFRCWSRLFRAIFTSHSSVTFLRKETWNLETWILKTWSLLLANYHNKSLWIERK